MKLKDNSYSLFYHHEQLKAAHARLHDTPDYFYRKVCRWYSETLNTPLKEVKSLPYQDLLREYYESIIEKMSFNEVFNYAKSDLLHVFVDREEDDLKAFAKELEAEQALTLKRKEAKKAKEAARLRSIEDEQLMEEQRQSLNRVEIPEINNNFEDEETEDGQ